MSLKKIGLNPLLVTYNKQYNTDVGSKNLANLEIKFDCDIFTQTVNPESVKPVSREMFRRFGSFYWYCLAGETVFPVQMAVRLKIPLFIWGVHQGVDKDLKHGFTKVVDDACREIRLRRMTHEKAVQLVNHYTTKPPKFFNLFTEWLGITESVLQFVWDWCWRRRSGVEYLVEPKSQAALSQAAEFSEFTLTPTYESTDKQDGFVLYPQGNRH